MRITQEQALQMAAELNTALVKLLEMDDKHWALVRDLAWLSRELAIFIHGEPAQAGETEDDEPAW